MDDREAVCAILLFNRITEIRVETDDCGDEWIVLTLETGHEAYLPGSIECRSPDALN